MLLKKIISTGVIILFILFGSSASARDLTYKTEWTESNAEGLSGTAILYQTTKASGKSVTDYDNGTKDALGYIAKGNYNDLVGEWGRLVVKGLSFHKVDDTGKDYIEGSTYHPFEPAYATSTNNAAYYDYFDPIKALDNPNITYSGTRVFVPEGNVTSSFLTTWYDFTADNTGDLINLKWKVINSKVRVDILQLSDTMLDTLLTIYEKYPELDIYGKGIMFSSIVATQYGLHTSGLTDFDRNNIYNASTHYQLMATTHWNPGNRGLQGLGGLAEGPMYETTSMLVNSWMEKYMYSWNPNWTVNSVVANYQAGASVINLYDNYLLFPKSPTDSEIYVQYTDEQGNLIPITPESKRPNITDGSEVTNRGDTKYPEKYIITPTDEIKFDATTSYGDYSYVGYEIVEAPTLDEAEKKLELLNPSEVDKSTSLTVKGTSDVKKYIINFIYSNSSTTVLVRHVDEEGKVVDGLQRTNQQILKDRQLSWINSSGSYGDFQERYSINGVQAFSAQSKDSTKVEVNGEIREYKYVGANISYAPLVGSFSSAYDSAYRRLKYSLKTTAYPAGINAEVFKDYIVLIELCYERVPGAEDLPALEMVGKLSFINNIDSNYKNATTNTTLDYVPSTGEITPYIDKAYPFVVRAIQYEKDTIQDYLTIDITVSATAKYSYQQTYYENETQADGSKKLVKKTRTISGERSASKTYSFRYDYTFIYYKLLNFKMYTIDNMVLYDNPSNQGNVLFAESNPTTGSQYEIGMSDQYYSLFNNSPGIIQDKTKPTISGNNISKKLSGYSSSSSAQSAANSAVNMLYSSVASEANVSVEYSYYNDYFTFRVPNDKNVLYDITDMLQKNEIKGTLSISGKNTSVTYDATKSGGSSIQYTKNLENYMRPTLELTNQDDFDKNYLTIADDTVNGLRIPSGQINYSIYENSKFNLGSEEFVSNAYTYEINANNLVSEQNPVDSFDFRDFSRTYIGEDEVNKVNVLTPLSLSNNIKVETLDYVDHTADGAGASILQAGAEFRVDPSSASYTKGGYSYSNTNEFITGYLMQFDFEIIYVGTNTAVYINGERDSGQRLRGGETIPEGTIIYIEGDEGYINATTKKTTDEDTIQQITNTIELVALSINITDDLVSNIYRNGNLDSRGIYVDGGFTSINTNENKQNQLNLIGFTDIYADSNHAISRTLKTKNIGRIYDFAVTDCNDLAFKDVFRINEDNNVNSATGIIYESGYYKWIVGTTGNGSMIERSIEEIGIVPTTLLPLGPYKHTSAKYINAPKMGYRISFDLKTSGFIEETGDNVSRKIEITPKYYYISKDGKIFDNEITLYYKNSSGNYVNFHNSGYTIYFTPNDGYRYFRNQYGTPDISRMSTKLEPLNMSNTLVLDGSMMSKSNDGFVQSWYGEFKLPNSTIAYSNNPSDSIDINNPYKDGYIGVIFEISSIDTEANGNETTLLYNTSNKELDSSDRTNTSQWDYEGYLGFEQSNVGSPLVGNLKLQLERDIWTINDAMYQKIKGTVALFDIDNRAADDFQ